MESAIFTLFFIAYTMFIFVGVYMDSLRRRTFAGFNALAFHTTLIIILWEFAKW